MNTSDAEGLMQIRDQLAMMNSQAQANTKLLIRIAEAVEVLAAEASTPGPAR